MAMNRLRERLFVQIGDNCVESRSGQCSSYSLAARIDKGGTHLRAIKIATLISVAQLVGAGPRARVRQNLYRSTRAALDGASISATVCLIQSVPIFLVLAVVSLISIQTSYVL